MVVRLLLLPVAAGQPLSRHIHKLAFSHFICDAQEGRIIDHILHGFVLHSILGVATVAWSSVQSLYFGKRHLFTIGHIELLSRSFAQGEGLHCNHRRWVELSWLEAQPGTVGVKALVWALRTDKEPVFHRLRSEPSKEELLSCRARPWCTAGPLQCYPTLETVANSPSVGGHREPHLGLDTRIRKRHGQSPENGGCGTRNKDSGVSRSPCNLAFATSQLRDVE